MKPVVMVAVLLSAGSVQAQEGHVEAQILGPNAAACAADAHGPAALVQTRGFKDRIGNLRVELYPAVDGDFLAPGSRLRSEGKVFQRIDMPTPPATRHTSFNPSFGQALASPCSVDIPSRRAPRNPGHPATVAVAEEDGRAVF